MIKYNLSFLLLFPTFSCESQTNGEWKTILPGSDEFNTKCKPYYFCKNPDKVKWSVVQESIYTLDNFMNRYNMICSSEVLIGMMGSLFFAGYVTGNLIFPSMIDKRGRRQVFLWGLVANLVIYLLFWLVPHISGLIYVHIGLFFLFGIATTSRVTSGYCLITEFVP